MSLCEKKIESKKEKVVDNIFVYNVPLHIMNNENIEIIILKYINRSNDWANKMTRSY